VWNFFSKADPPWWVPALTTALLLTVAVVVTMGIVDNRRADRESLLHDADLNQAQVLENLRFVREYANAQRQFAGAQPGAVTAGNGACAPSRHSAAAVRQSFESINLSGQNLAYLQLPNTNFARANMDGGRLVGAVFAPNSDLAGASMVEASAVDADLSEASLVNADLTNADLHGAHLCGANLAGAKLAGANLSNATLTGIDFSDANGTWIAQEGTPDVGFVVHGKVNLSRADLAGADLTGASNLDAAMLYDIYYDNTTKWPAGFSPQPSREKRCVRADKFSNPSSPCLEGEEGASR
jgi:uncharacterized protein YjbI with pentapeptide repeats